MAESTATPLHVPQVFADGASCQVRTELEELVRRDLLGGVHRKVP